MLLDAIMFVWKSGVVLSREGAVELISLEEKIEKATIIADGGIDLDFKESEAKE